MDKNELYEWRFRVLVIKKLGQKLDFCNTIYSKTLNELESEYPDFFNEYKKDGLLSPKCYADDKEISLICHNYNKNYKNIPVYYAVLEKNLVTEYQGNDIIVDTGIAYKSGYYRAGMTQDVYNNYRTYWRCIPDDKNINPYQCCLLHKSIYEWYPKICANKTDSTYKIYDHDYNIEHCTSFSKNFNDGEFFKNRIMVISTDKKLLDDYIAFYTGICINNLEILVDKITKVIENIKK